MDAFNNFVLGMSGSIALTGAMALGMKILQIIFTLFLCWVLIRLSSKLVNKVLSTQVQKKHQKTAKTAR